MRISGLPISRFFRGLHQPCVRQIATQRIGEIGAARCEYLTATAAGSRIKRFLYETCSASFQSIVSQLAEQPGQVHFRLSGLETALEGGLESPFGFWVARAFAEEIGIPDGSPRPTRA